MKESIESFNLLSVRDNRTLEFLKWLKIENSNEVSIIPDPVLSFDLIPYIDLRFLKDKLIKLGIDFTKARMGIYSSQCNVMDRIINHLRRRDIQIVAISDYLGEVDISLVENGFTPIEWAFIPRFMTYCISNRMHGCITNLINNTPFIALDLRDKPELKGTTKIRDLLKSFDLSEYYWGIHTNYESEILNICDFLVDHTWPTKKVHTGIKKRKQIAYSYINKAKCILENEALHNPT